MCGWKFATRCRLFLLTLATMASYIRAPLLINSFCFSSCHREERSMLAAPTWYRWRWSMTLPGMGQRGRPGAVAVSASVICRLDRWTCFIDDMKSHIGRQRISIQRHAISHERGSHLTPWEMCASWWLSDKWLFSLEKSGYMETDMQIRWWVRAV